MSQDNLKAVLYLKCTSYWWVWPPGTCATCQSLAACVHASRHRYLPWKRPARNQVRTNLSGFESDGGDESWPQREDGRVKQVELNLRA